MFTSAPSKKSSDWSIGINTGGSFSPDKKETEIETISLDYFVEKHEVGDVDFIKIDVQGAELDVSTIP